MPLKNDDLVLKNGHLFCNLRYEAQKLNGVLKVYGGFLVRLFWHEDDDFD